MKRNTEYNKKKYQMQWRDAPNVMERNIKSTVNHYKITDNSHLSFRHLFTRHTIIRNFNLRRDLTTSLWFLLSGLYNRINQQYDFYNLDLATFEEQINMSICTNWMRIIICCTQVLNLEAWKKASSIFTFSYFCHRNIMHYRSGVHYSFKVRGKLLIAYTKSRFN